jgi:hypothetical protein
MGIVLLVLELSIIALGFASVIIVHRFQAGQCKAKQVALMGSIKTADEQQERNQV